MLGTVGLVCDAGYSGICIALQRTRSNWHLGRCLFAISLATSSEQHSQLLLTHLLVDRRT